MKKLNMNLDEKSFVYPEYSGMLTCARTTGDVKIAAACYDNQRRRCYCKTNPRYKDNGAKGLTVDYQKRQFISWYLYHIKSFTGGRPSVGCIDHSKGYSFDNIRIESLSENSSERIKRVGPTRKRRPVHIIDFNSGKIIKSVASLAAAEAETGIHAGHIYSYCMGRHKKTKSGLTFRFNEK